MPQHPLYHLHRQNRLLKIRQPFFPSRWIRILDRIVMAAAILGPVLTLPQVYKIWVLQNASGVSLISWGSYLLLNFPLLAYGIAHRDRVIVVMYILWILVNALVVAGIVMFG